MLPASANTIKPRHFRKNTGPGSRGTKSTTRSATFGVDCLPAAGARRAARHRFGAVFSFLRALFFYYLTRDWPISENRPRLYSRGRAQTSLRDVACLLGPKQAMNGHEWP